MMSLRLLLAAVGVGTLALLGPGPAPAAGNAPDDLLEQYQPVLVLDQTERFAPVPVEPFIAEADLEQFDGSAFVAEAVPPPGLPVHGDGWRLDHRSCSPIVGLPSIACYAAGPTAAPVVYGRVDTHAGMTVVQYWIFYEYDFWSLQYPATNLVWQAHEGDWEVVTIVLDRNRDAVEAGYSQHCGGERRDWAGVPKASGSDHPLVFVGTGSHANLFAPGPHPIDLACYPQQAQDFFHAFGVTPVDVNVPGTTLGPDTTAIVRVHDNNPRWLRFPGTWGETQYVHAPPPFGTIAFGTSPVGPAFQSEWDDPVGTIAGYRPG